MCFRFGVQRPIDLPFYEFGSTRDVCSSEDATQISPPIDQVANHPTAHQPYHMRVLVHLCSHANFERRLVGCLAARTCSPAHADEGWGPKLQDADGVRAGVVDAQSQPGRGVSHRGVLLPGIIRTRSVSGRVDPPAHRPNSATKQQANCVQAV